MDFQNLINAPPGISEEYTKLKEDIAHIFHMIPISLNHGACPAFLFALQDHLLQWDPIAMTAVDKTC